eukprot:8529573-Pyramimonas_sp.AAC.1
MFEPECSTWLNTTVYHTKRDRLNGIYGDEGRRDVLEANFVAEIVWDPQLSRFASASRSGGGIAEAMRSRVKLAHAQSRTQQRSRANEVDREET